MSTNYPEHDKLTAVKAESQTIGEFLDWAQNGGVVLRQWKDYPGDGGETSWDESGYYPPDKATEQLLAEFFNIDLKKLSDEKEAMYQELRAAANP